MNYTFKKSYITSSGSTFYIGESYPEHYLLSKFPQLIDNIVLKDEYLLSTSNVSFEDITKEPKVIGEHKATTLKTFELKEKKDIINAIYINAISFEDLQKVQGIGEKAASKLISTREIKKFENVEELTKLVSTVKWDKYTIMY